jgi:hypothetical protein
MQEPVETTPTIRRNEQSGSCESIFWSEATFFESKNLLGHVFYCLFVVGVVCMAMLLVISILEKHLDG